MTRLAILLCILCAPVMAETVCTETDTGQDCIRYKRVPIIDPCALDYVGSTPCMESVPTAINANVISAGKMRCFITNEHAYTDFWTNIGKREFYIECEPVTEEQ